MGIHFRRHRCYLTLKMVWLFFSGEWLSNQINNEQNLISDCNSFEWTITGRDQHEMHRTYVSYTLENIYLCQTILTLKVKLCDTLCFNKNKMNKESFFKRNFYRRQFFISLSMEKFVKSLHFECHSISKSSGLKYLFCSWWFSYFQIRTSKSPTLSNWFVQKSLSKDEIRSDDEYERKECDSHFDSNNWNKSTLIECTYRIFIVLGQGNMQLVY